MIGNIPEGYDDALHLRRDRRLRYRGGRSCCRVVSGWKEPGAILSERPAFTQQVRSWRASWRSIGVNVLLVAMSLLMFAMGVATAGRAEEGIDRRLGVFLAVVAGALLVPFAPRLWLRLVERIVVSPDLIDIVYARSYWFAVPRRVRLKPSEIASVATMQQVMEGRGRFLQPSRSRRVLIELGKLTTKDGRSIPFANTRNDALPVAEIAKAIAEVANVPWKDYGARLRGIYTGVAGPPTRPWEGRRITRKELFRLDI